MVDAPSSTPRPTVYFPIEIKARELKSKTLLSLCAARLGLRVYIGTKDAVDRLVRAKETVGGVYFYKGGKPPDVLRSIKTKVDHFVVLDEEMGPMVERLEMNYRKRIYPGTEHLVDRMFVVGAAHQEVIAKVRPQLADVVEVTGWPRIDLWGKDFAYLHEDGVTAIARRFGKYVLFSSNFGVLDEDEVAGELARLLRLHTEADEYEHYRELLERAVSEFREFIELARVADNDADMPTLVVRPHPSEDAAKWKTALAGLRKVHVEYDSDISPWIGGAQALLHRGCTSSLQAHLAGVPSIYLTLPSSRPDESSLSYRISVPARDPQQLAALCQGALQGRLQPARAGSIAREVYSNSELASVRVARSLASMQTAAEKSHRPPRHVRWVRYLVGATKRALLDMLPGYKLEARKTRARKTPGGIHASEIAGLARKLMPGLQPSIVEVDYNLVEIVLPSVREQTTLR